MEEMNPFVLDLEEGEPFADALLIQFVPTGKVLFPDGRLGPGFFLEAPEAPGPGWEKARLTATEKAVDGWAAREIVLAPVALRFRWVQGQPGAWAPLERYEEGARGHAQVLGVLRTEGPQPLWVVITAKGLASRDLIRAFRAHKARVARRLRDPKGRPLAPFAAWMTLRVGEGRRLPAGVAHGLARKEEELVRLSAELGWAIRERYPEAVRWRAAWGGENGEAIQAEAPDAPEAPETVPAAQEPTPEPVPEAAMPVPEALASETAPATPAPEGAEGPGPDAEAGLLFLLGMGGSIAMARLRQAFEDLPEEPTEAVRELARRKPQAGFWKDIPQALDHFLAWAEEFPRLRAIAPARLRTLKERLGLVPASVREEELQELAALAALRWLFRPREREALEALLREPDLA
jgi:hypothetical protein